MAQDRGSNSADAVTGEVLLEAQFDTNVTPYFRWVVTLILIVSVVGILLIPLWLLFSGWYGLEFHRRMSGRLTAQALEIRKGVFFRSESTIPLNRITDLRLHDDPLMRHYGLRSLKVETAGQGRTTGSEGDLVGVINAAEFRNAVLLQRQKVVAAETTDESAAAAPGGAAGLLTEIRDILARMEAKQ